MVDLLLPYEFYPEVVAFCALAAGVYAVGLRRMVQADEIAGIGAAIAWFTGVVLTYAVMHTYLDYLSQYMFWVHRGQHLVLHHLAPFLMVLGAPHRVLPYAFAPGPRARLANVLRHPVIRWPYRFVQHPVIAPILFIGLIFFWLDAEIHFDAMLSQDLYRIMNASMLIDGLLFWWLIVDPRGRQTGGLSFGLRILLLWAIMIPQIILGAHIGLADGVLYDVYAVCGRAWPLDPITDQRIGGFITWIPAAMMSVIGALVVFRLWLLESAQPAPAAVNGGKI
ncbi:MAG: cytochrome c oxidase assembly protein [Halofilum sp. (in: g-proteobacteria)]